MSHSAAGRGVGGLGVSGTAGSRLGEGLTSEFLHVLVIADAKSVSSYPLGADLEPKLNVEQGDMRDRMLAIIEKR